MTRLAPDVIRRAIVLKHVRGSSGQFESLIPTRGMNAASPDWLKVEAISLESDARGDHLVLWRKNVRHLVYRGDVILPAGTEGFLVLPEELATYLMPAFYRMLHAEGHEPSWVTQEGSYAIVAKRAESDFSTLNASTEASA